MKLRKSARYYRERVLQRLDEAGLPLRFRSLLWYERSCAMDAAQHIEYANGGTVRPISIEEFTTLRWAGDPSVTHYAVTWRRSGPRWAVGAVTGDQLDAFCWLEANIAEIGFLDLDCPLKRGQIYLSKVWVYPAKRGQGLGRALLKSAAAYAGTLGGSRLASACVPENQPMMSLFPELGWHYARRIDYVRVGPLAWYSIRDRAAKCQPFMSSSRAANELVRSEIAGTL